MSGAPSEAFSEAIGDVIDDIVIDDNATEAERAQREAKMWRARSEALQTLGRKRKNQYDELKTHIQDVLNDTGSWDDFDVEKLRKHGIVKPQTTYSCEYEVKYTGTITIKADSEEAARTWADHHVSANISCQLPDFEDSDITDQNHNEFEVEINDCEEQ